MANCELGKQCFPLVIFQAGCKTESQLVFLLVSSRFWLGTTRRWGKPSRLRRQLRLRVKACALCVCKQISRRGATLETLDTASCHAPPPLSLSLPPLPPSLCFQQVIRNARRGEQHLSQG